jgi:hypothetical protein
MKKEPAGGSRDELRPEYDLSRLKGGMRSKYYQRATARSNLVLIEPDLASQSFLHLRDFCSVLTVKVKGIVKGPCAAFWALTGRVSER